jgi:hypothetical protein
MFIPLSQKAALIARGTALISGALSKNGCYIAQDLQLPRFLTSARETSLESSPWSGVCESEDGMQAGRLYLLGSCPLSELSECGMRMRRENIHILSDIIL